MNFSIAGRKRKYAYSAPVTFGNSSSSDSELPIPRIEGISESQAGTKVPRPDGSAAANRIPRPDGNKVPQPDGIDAGKRKHTVDDAAGRLDVSAPPANVENVENVLSTPHNDRSTLRIHSNLLELCEGSDDDSDIEDIGETIKNTDDFNTILNELSNQWIEAEINHHVSKACSDEFWKIAHQWFFRLMTCKQKQKIKRKVPQFTHIRRQLYDSKTPKVNLDITYQEKDTGEVHVVRDVEATPVSKYPANKFTKLYEVASVPVSEIIKIHELKCPNANKNAQLSLDGVSESKSTSVSMDVFSMKLRACRTIYPCRIVRPLGRFKVNNGEHFKKLCEDLKTNGIDIDKIVADNPKRSDLRCCKLFNSYYPCEYCFSKGTRTQTSGSVQKQKDLAEKIKIQTREITEKIALLQKQPQSEIRDENIALLTNVKNEIAKNTVKYSHQIVWPHTSQHGDLRTREDVLDIVQKIESGAKLTIDDCKGVIARSHLLDIRDFDYVHDLPAEYMHSGCLGLIKRLVELTFQVGENRPRITKRKLSSPAKFNILISKIKVTKETSRRVRELDFAVYKAQEFRNLSLYFFPIIIECIEENANERHLWLYLAYMFRACTLPNTEYDSEFHEKFVKICMEQFYITYENLFGIINCTYSVHVICSHLPEIRGKDPLTSNSAFVFENFYGLMRDCYVPGTNSTLKQIFKKVLLKNTIAKHLCEAPVTITTHETAMERNNLIYTYKEKKYCIYKVMDINNEKEVFICKRVGKYPVTYDYLPVQLDWNSVGVFKQGGVLDELVEVEMNDVAGKVMVVQDNLITCPRNVLREK